MGGGLLHGPREGAATDGGGHASYCEKGEEQCMFVLCVCVCVCECVCIASKSVYDGGGFDVMQMETWRIYILP